MIDTNELRRLAQAATPGPWWFNRDGLNHSFARGVVEINANDWHALAGAWAVNGAKHSDEGVANAEFIAAANPAAVSELLDRLEAAEKERDAATRLADRLALALNTSNHERDNLQAKITEMEKQEPVGYMPLATKAALEAGGTGVIWNCRDRGAADEPLYALPGAKGEER